MNTDIEHTQNAIGKGVHFLSERQFHHGEFLVYMGEGEYLEKWCIPDSTTFATAMICNALLPVQHDPDVAPMLQKAAAFLKYQMMRGGTWNFYTVWHKIFPFCPADTDSTSCASFFLKRIEYPYPDNSGLLLANRNRKGLFYTWFTIRPRDLIRLCKTAIHWQLILRGFKHPIGSFLLWTKGLCHKHDVDALVNANALSYLGKNDELLPVARYLVKIIELRKETQADKWYKNPLELYYAIARAYAEGIEELDQVRSPIIERILPMVLHDGCIGHSPANTAMAATTLIHLHYRGKILENAICYLMNTQASNGSWKRQALWIAGASLVWGSEELTTALCVEALARYKAVETANEL